MNTILIILSVLLNCSAQLMMRKGLLIIGTLTKSNFFDKVGDLLSSIWLWSASGCFLGSIILWIIVISRVEISYAYLFNSLGYVIVTLGGYYLFNEQITPLRLFGIAIICIGIIIVVKS